MAPTVITGRTGQIVPESDILEFKSQLTGKVVIKGEAPEDEYKDAIRRFNEAYVLEAALVVFVETEQDVAASLKFVQKWNIDFTIACGRHSYHGASGIDGGLVIDLQKLNQVSIDKENLTVKAGGGSRAKDVEIPLHKEGLYVVFGADNDTGIGGLTLGGGTGFLTGQYGSASDNLIAARVVLADGRIVEASESTNADLFWALRGGGSNFGIVTEFTFKVYQQRGPVFCGPLIFAPEKIRSVLDLIEKMKEWVTKANGRLVIFVAFAKFPGQSSLGPACMVFYDGPEDEARQILAPLFELEPVVAGARMIPYIEVTTANPLTRGPPTHQRYTTSNAIQTFPVDVGVLEEIIKDFGSLLDKYGEAVAPSKMVMEIRSYAKISSIPLSAAAYATRREGVITVVDVQYSDAVDDSLMRTEVATLTGKLREKIRAKRPTSEAQADVNANISSGADRLQDLFGENLPKLRQLKRKYDPDFIFRRWHPIPPAEA